MKGFMVKHFGLFMSLVVIFGITIGTGLLFLLNYCFGNQYVYYIVCYLGLFLILTLFGLLFDLANKCKLMQCPNNCCKFAEPQFNQEEQNKKQEANQNEKQPNSVEKEAPLKQQNLDEKENDLPQKQPTHVNKKEAQNPNNANQIPDTVEEVHKSQPQKSKDVPQDEIVERKQIIKVKKVIGKDIDDLILKKMKQEERENKENETN